MLPSLDIDVMLIISMSDSTAGMLSTLVAMLTESREASMGSCKYTVVSDDSERSEVEDQREVIE